MTTMTAAEIASSPPTAHARVGGRDSRGRDPRSRDSRGQDPRCRDLRRREPWRPPSPSSPPSWPLPPLPPDPGHGSPADAAASARAPASAPAPAAIGPGRPSPRDRRAPNSASRALAAGRSPGCLARHLLTSGRSSSGRLSSSAGLLTSRYISAALDPEPNGPCPVHAKVSTAPRLKMSLAGLPSSPRACSGDENPGQPSPSPGNPLAAAAYAIPKSASRGPSSASRTFEGWRFPCTTPAAWMTPRPSASPLASVSRVRAGTGPCSRIASASVRPSTYAVASHGTSASRSASITGATKAPLTFRAAATSARNRVRNQGSPASSSRMTFTATFLPLAERPRNTWPSPPRPSSPSSWYGPIVRASSDVSGATTLNPHS